MKSKANQAMKKKKYSEAVKETDRLLALKPDDPYLLKMRGILSLLSGDKKDGREYLEKAVKGNPSDRQARLYLGKLYLQERQPDLAKRELNYIVQHPDKDKYYADKAARTLGTIDSLARKRKPKPWNIYATYGMEYDDNVPLASDVLEFKNANLDDRNGIRFRMLNGASYDYLRDQKKKVGMAYYFSQSWHTDHLNEFNFRNHALQHYANYMTRLWGKPLTMGLRYVFSHGTLSSETFSSSNSVLPFVALQTSENTNVSLYDNMSFNNFRNKGSNVPDTSRDGLYNTAGIMGTVLFHKKKRSLSVSYENGYNQTEGNNFDARIQATRITFRTALVAKFNFETSFSYIHDNHHNFASLPHREDNRFDYSAKLLRPIGKYFELRALYSYTKSKNTHAGVLGQFDYSRNIVGGEVAFKY